MSDLDMIARLLALEAGRAQPIASHLHVAVSPDALVICPIAMAGEDTTIHVVACGHVGEPPEISCVPDPRIRDDQYRLFAWLGGHVAEYFERCRAAGSYPQVWVSAAPAVDLLDVLSERLRYSRDDAQVRHFGELLTYLTERAPIAGQQALQTATSALRQHWATGQQAAEDEHLGTLLVWLDPPDDVHPGEAIAAAERMPMGVKTDPQFDQRVLEPLVRAYNEARRTGAPRGQLAGHGARVQIELERVVRPIYAATQRAIAILRDSGLPELGELDALEEREHAAFASFMDGREQGIPLARYDSPKVAAYRLVLREDATQNVEAATQLGDQVARAQGRMDGRVVVGVVENPRRIPAGSGQVRLVFDLVSEQRVLHVRRHDALCWVEDRRLRVTVEDVQRQGAETRLTLVMLSGQRAVGLPTTGARLELVRQVPDWYRLGRTRAQMKKRLAATPWTHQEGTLTPVPARSAPADPLAAVEALR